GVARGDLAVPGPPRIELETDAADLDRFAMPVGKASAGAFIMTGHEAQWVRVVKNHIVRAAPEESAPAGNFHPVIRISLRWIAHGSAVAQHDGVARVRYAR